VVVDELTGDAVTEDALMRAIAAEPSAPSEAADPPAPPDLPTSPDHSTPPPGFSKSAKSAGSTHD
jgi:galactofuranose transport system ATP-binding protein